MTQTPALSPAPGLARTRALARMDDWYQVLRAALGHPGVDEGGVREALRRIGSLAAYVVELDVAELELQA